MRQLFKLVVNNLDNGERFTDWHFGIDTLQDKLIELGTRLEFTGYSWKLTFYSYHGKRRGWEPAGTLTMQARYSRIPPTPGFFQVSEDLSDHCPHCDYNPCTIERTGICYKAAEDEWR